MNKHEQRRLVVDDISFQIDAGISAVDAVTNIADTVSSRRLKKSLRKSAESFDAGDDMATSLKASGIFTPSQIEMIRSGESSGNVPRTLNIIKQELDREIGFSQQLRTAMVYPMIVAVLAVIIGVGVSIFLLPRLAEAFGGLGAELPFLTRAIISLGDFINGLDGLDWFIGFSIVVILGSTMFASSRIRKHLRTTFFKLPGFNKVAKTVETARFCSSLGFMLEGGMGVVQSLAAAEHAAQSPKYKKMINCLNQSIGQGDSFSQAFSSNSLSRKLLPGSLRSLIASSEKSGQLSKSLISAGQRYEEKVGVSVKALSQVIEPLLLLFVAAAVTLLAIAVILPVYSLVGGF